MMKDERLSSINPYGIEDFMRNSYAYCKEHEAEIRMHIQKSESALIINCVWEHSGNDTIHSSAWTVLVKAELQTGR